MYIYFLAAFSASFFATCGILFYISVRKYSKLNKMKTIVVNAYNEAAEDYRKGIEEVRILKNTLDDEKIGSEWIDYKEFAEIMGCAPQAIYYIAKHNNIRTRKIRIKREGKEKNHFWKTEVEKLAENYKAARQEHELQDS